MGRYLLVANQTLGGQHLLDELDRLTEEGPLELHVVVPATPTGAQGLGAGGADAEEIARNRLRDALERFGETATQIDGHVGSSRPVDAVREAVERHGPFDGIILSTLPAGLSRWLGMDLPRRVEREVDLPLIHVEAPAEVAGIEPEGIVVGVDGSRDAMRALQWALSEAATHDTHVVAVHVFSYPSLIATGFPEVPVAEPIDYEEVEERAHDTLDQAVSDALDATGSQVEVHRHVVAGAPALTLLRAAQHATLLVVGSRGVGGFRGLILGSVSQQVIQHAPCPVVVVPGGNDNGD